jgi:hypothetical protein
MAPARRRKRPRAPMRMPAIAPPDNFFFCSGSLSGVGAEVGVVTADEAPGVADDVDEAIEDMVEPVNDVNVAVGSTMSQTCGAKITDEVCAETLER